MEASDVVAIKDYLRNADWEAFNLPTLAYIETVEEHNHELIRCIRDYGDRNVIEAAKAAGLL